jgi:hypothetical protein
MYASCGWFFDDVGGIESAIVIRQAAHVLDLWQGLGDKPPTAAVLDILADARSNVPTIGTGADVFRRVRRDRITPAKAVADIVFRRLAPAATLERPSHIKSGYTVKETKPDSTAAGIARRAKGVAIVSNRRTGETIRARYVARHDGRGRFSLSMNGETVRLSDLPEETEQAIAAQVVAAIAAEPVTLETSRGGRRATRPRLRLQLGAELAMETSGERAEDERPIPTRVGPLHPRSTEWPSPAARTASPCPTAKPSSATYWPSSSGHCRRMTAASRPWAWWPSWSRRQACPARPTSDGCWRISCGKGSRRS